ncbi:MAG: mechanosensitive ion channel family protein [Thiotrichales bacterium]
MDTPIGWLPDTLSLLHPENRLLLILLGTAIVSLIASRWLAQPVAAREDSSIVDSLREAARMPVILLVWMTGIALAIAAGASGRGLDPPAWSQAFSYAGVIAVVAWLLWRWLGSYEQVPANAGEAHGGTAPGRSALLFRLLRVLILATLAVMLLHVLGFPVTGMLVVIGVIGAAFGWGARDLLANLWGGVTLYLDRPFFVGDWIRVVAPGHEGVVEHIGWRTTRLRTLEQASLVVPNSTFTASGVENLSQRSHFRINEIIRLRYEDLEFMPEIVGAVRQMVEAHPGIDRKQGVIVNFTAFGESSVDFLVHTFTRTASLAEYHQLREDLLLEISEIIARHGAELVFRSQTLNVNMNRNSPYLTIES